MDDQFKLKRDERLLDDVGWRILEALQEDARISFADLGRLVGLSSPAAAERVRRLEDAGIITGYHVGINFERVGLPVSAIIRISNPGDRGDVVAELAQQMPEVVECHRITGRESYVLRVRVSSVAHLERLIGKFEPYGQTATSLILSSPVDGRIIKPLDDD